MQHKIKSKGRSRDPCILTKEAILGLYEGLNWDIFKNRSCWSRLDFSCEKSNYVSSIMEKPQKFWLLACELEKSCHFPGRWTTTMLMFTVYYFVGQRSWSQWILYYPTLFCKITPQWSFIEFHTGIIEVYTFLTKGTFCYTFVIPFKQKSVVSIP